MRRGRAARVVLALAPFVVVAGGVRLLVPVVATRVVRGIARIAAVAPRSADDSGEVGGESSAGADTAREGARVGAPPRVPAGRGHPAGHPSGLDVPAERLARLTARQLRGIGATTALDAEGRPVGARLTGVGALGVGLADGDVVTSIDGQPTTTGDAATAAAFAAYASGNRAVHGRVLRDGQAITVTVHVPAPVTGPPPQGATAATRGEPQPPARGAR